MNFYGLIVGVCLFLIIGIFHPIVIKAEYYWGVKCWPLFAVGGVVACVASLFVDNHTVSCLLAVLGVCFLWSILELFQQRERVRKGWFPKNPKRNDY